MPRKRSTALPEQGQQRADRRYALGLIEGLLRREPLLRVPVVYLHLTGGDHQSALFLDACVQRSAAASDPDGWFTMTHAEWQAELSLSDRTVRRLCRILSRWIQTRRTRTGEGTVPLRYRVDLEALRASIEALPNRSGAPRARRAYRRRQERAVEAAREAQGAQETAGEEAGDAQEPA